MGQSLSYSEFSILVVEDDPIIRMDAVDLCEDAGFSVHEAKNSSVALSLLQQHPDIRILFTDIEMPGDMDGLMLAHAVHNCCPTIKIIIASGKLKVAEDNLPSGSLFLQKPYRPSVVAKALNDFAAQIS